MTERDTIAKLIGLEEQRQRHFNQAWMLDREITLLRQQLRAACFLPPTLPEINASAPS